MGWSVGENKGRDIGYGVPAFCDTPGCKEVIDRGISYLCGELFDEETGCGLYFCEEHSYANEEGVRVCKNCLLDHKPCKPKPDHPDWLNHKLTDESWKEWREKYPDEVRAIKLQLFPGKKAKHKGCNQLLTACKDCYEDYRKWRKSNCVNKSES